MYNHRTNELQLYSWYINNLLKYTHVDPVINTLITLTSPRVIDKINDNYLVSHADIFIHMKLNEWYLLGYVDNKQCDTVFMLMRNATIPSCCIGYG